MRQTKKIGQVEFIDRVAKRSGIKKDIVRTVFQAILHEIVENVTDNVRVTFSNFGSFYCGSHKGHHAQYGNRNIEDYVNLKFSAARGVNHKIRLEQKNRATADEEAV